MTTTQKILIGLGVTLLLVGLLWPLIAKLGLGRLPGDVVVEQESLRFYFPIVTMLLVSLVLSLIFWLFRR